MHADYIPFAFPGIAAVGCAFQTRHGGVSKGAYGGANISHDVGDTPDNVVANRTALMHSAGISTWAELKQVHGDVMTISPGHVPADSPATVEADGSATDRPGLALVIKTADCQPIMLAHTSGKYVAALHAGWRGNHIGFPVSGVAAFCDTYGLAPKDVMAVRGPSLGPAAAEFVNFDTEWGAKWSAWYTPATKTMNLWELTRHQLQEAGIPREHIFGLDLCTYSLTDDFFSYRRAKQSGRQASIIWIKE